MPASDLTLRLQWSGKSQVVKDLSLSDSLQDLQALVFSITGFPIEKQKILASFPPRELIPTAENDNTLQGLGVKSGDSLRIEQLSQPKTATTTATGTTTTPSNTSSNFQTASSSTTVPTIPSSSSSAPIPTTSSASNNSKNTSIASTPPKTTLHEAQNSQQKSSSLSSSPKNSNNNLNSGKSQQQSSNSNNTDNSGQKVEGICVRRIVPADNSCLFNSIWYCVVARQITSPNGGKELRDIVAAAVKNDPFTYNDGFLGMQPEKYYKWILDSQHWGGGIELSILSNHYKIEIDVVDTQTLRIDRFGEDQNYPNRIILIFDGIHYDALAFQLFEGAPQDIDITMFPTSDDSVLQRALQLAKAAHDKRQFTNLAGFTLRCLACQAQLKGQKEAQQHATETGHTNFGEL